MSIEDLVKKLMALAKKPALTKPELEEARGLMIELKKSGLKNGEISEFTLGRWSEPTVKTYTGGTIASKGSPWPTVVSALAGLIEAGISLEQAEEVVHISKVLKTKKLDLDKVADFLAVSDSLSIDPAALLHWYEQMTEAALSFSEVKEALELNSQLAGQGFKINSLPLLVKLAGTFGDAEKVLEATAAQGTLGKIQADIAAAGEDLKKIGTEGVAAENKLQETIAKIQKLNKLLEALEKVKKLGFNLKNLTDLANLTDKFGGIKNVLKAVRAYRNLVHLRGDIADAEGYLKTVEAEITEKETKSSHLTSAVEMCRRLISEFKLGIDAISAILSVAAKFGSPIEVLKALETYGKIAYLNSQENELQGKVTFLKQENSKLEGEHQQGLHNLELLAATLAELAKQVGKLQGELAAKDDFKRSLEVINNPTSADYGGHIKSVLLMAFSLSQFVSHNVAQFNSTEQIKFGLRQLILELGGSP